MRLGLLALTSTALILSAVSAFAAPPLQITLEYPHGMTDFPSAERVPSGERKANMAIGPSAPDKDPDNQVNSVVRAQGGGPSRKSGGEVIGFGFLNPKNKKHLSIPVRKVRLIAYSASRKGKILVHTVGTSPETKRALWNPLTRFNSIEQGSHAENHGGKVRLAHGDSVTITLPKEISVTRMLLTLEAYGHSDASVIAQLDTRFENGTVAVAFGRAVVKDHEEPDEPVHPPSNPRPTPQPEPEPAPKPVHKQCDSDKDCPGFANDCFGGRCTQPGFQCDSDEDCPGFANDCFGGKCTKQEALCDEDSDCPGFANDCFAGKCTNP